MEEKEGVDFQDVVSGKEQDPMADYFERYEKKTGSWKSETPTQESEVPRKEFESAPREAEESSQGAAPSSREANASGTSSQESIPEERGSKQQKSQTAHVAEQKDPERESSAKKQANEAQSSGGKTSVQSEEYEDEVDRIVNGKMRNGILGKIIGVIKGVVAVAAEIAGTAIRRLLLGERGTINVGKTYQQYQNAENLNQEVKKQKETKDRSKEQAKERSEEQRGQEGPTKEKSDEPSKDPKEQTSCKKVINAADLNPLDVKDRMEVTEQVLQSKEVQELFRQYGYFAISNEEGIGIHQDLKDAIGVTNFITSKEELLTGNAWSLTTAIHAVDQIGKPNSETQGDKLNAALKANLLTSSLLYQLHSEQIQQALANGQSVELSHTNFTSENGVSKISIVVSPEKDGPQAGLYYNRKYIAPVPCEMLEGISPLQKQVYPSLSEKLNQQYQTERNNTFSFGSETRSIQFTRTDKDSAVVTMIKDGEETELGTFSFKSEQGVHDLAKSLKENDWNLGRFEQKNLIDKTNARTAAYTVASVINPDMAPVIGRDNQYRSVVTGKYEDAGSGYMHTERTEEGITVYKNIPDPKEGMVTQPVYQFDSIENLDVNELAIQIHKAANEIRHTEAVVDGYARQFRSAEIDCGVRKCSSSEALQSVQGYSTMQIIDGNDSCRIVDRTTPHIPNFGDMEPPVREEKEEPDISFVADVELDEEEIEFHCSGNVSEDEIFEEVPEEYSLD